MEYLEDRVNTSMQLCIYKKSTIKKSQTSILESKVFFYIQKLIL